jgi:hypothetical protein
MIELETFGRSVNAAVPSHFEEHLQVIPLRGPWADLMACRHRSLPGKRYNKSTLGGAKLHNQICEFA